MVSSGQSLLCSSLVGNFLQKSYLPNFHLAVDLLSFVVFCGKGVYIFDTVQRKTLKVSVTSSD